MHKNVMFVFKDPLNALIRRPKHILQNSEMLSPKHLLVSVKSEGTNGLSHEKILII